MVLGKEKLKNTASQNGELVIVDKLIGAIVNFNSNPPHEDSLNSLTIQKPSVKEKSKGDEVGDFIH